MISECYNCKHANEYCLPYWFHWFDPTCSKGEPMYIEENCRLYEQIGRLSR